MPSLIFAFGGASWVCVCSLFAFAFNWVNLIAFVNLLRNQNSQIAIDCRCKPQSPFRKLFFDGLRMRTAARCQSFSSVNQTCVNILDFLAGVCVVCPLASASAIFRPVAKCVLIYNNLRGLNEVRKAPVFKLI